MKTLLIIILFTILTACNEIQRESDLKTFNFGSFSIQTPKSWTKIPKKGVDSFVGRIAIDDNDTLNFDLGWYSNSLYEYDPTILDSNMIGSIDTSLVDISAIIFVKNRMTVDLDKYRKNNVSWDTIDGRKAKIVSPRQSGIGTTGIYIDSLWVSGSQVDRFNLNGENLSTANQKLVLNSFQTLKFCKK